MLSRWRSLRSLSTCWVALSYALGYFVDKIEFESAFVVLRASTRAVLCSLGFFLGASPCSDELYEASFLETRGTR